MSHPTPRCGRRARPRFRCHGPASACRSAHRASLRPRCCQRVSHYAVQRLLQTVALGAGEPGTQEAHDRLAAAHLREVGEAGDSVFGEALLDGSQVGGAERVFPPPARVASPRPRTRYRTSVHPSGRTINTVPSTPSTRSREPGRVPRHRSAPGRPSRCRRRTRPSRPWNTARWRSGRPDPACCVFSLRGGRRRSAVRRPARSLPARRMSPPATRSRCRSARTTSPVPQAARPSHIMKAPGAWISSISSTRPATIQMIQSLIPACRLPTGSRRHRGGRRHRRRHDRRRRGGGVFGGGGVSGGPLPGVPSSPRINSIA